MMRQSGTYRLWLYPGAWTRMLGGLAALSTAIWCCHAAHGAVYNLKVVTDASPDYSDMDSMIHSITDKWETTEQKLWAMFYWNHIARRQTTPMIVHGLACTDPIRQFNDYGYTMCSTIAGINCAIWDAMGLRARYWDITNHTVSEVEYGGRWHMYDNSLSAIYTLCDGKTIAGVEDIGAPGGCEASGGREEPGHIARYHCLTATSPNGFLTGSDTTRSLDEEYRCFNPNGLKYRWYYYDWDRGHRYVLNLRRGEAYTRYYRKLGEGPETYVPNGGRDPEDVRFQIRANGERTYRPPLTPEGLRDAAVALVNARALPAGGVEPRLAGQPAEVTFRVEGSNVLASLTIRGVIALRGQADWATVSVSTTNGLTWQEIWSAAGPGEPALEVRLIEEVSGAYEVLVKVTLLAAVAADGARLNSIQLQGITMLNAKTQPRLLLGRNTVYVGAGQQTGSVVVWPDLQGEAWKPLAVEHHNVVSQAQHPGYQGVMHLHRPGEDGYVVFRLDTPGDLTQVHYGARMYNRAPRSHIDFYHSFDDGATWTQSYSLTDTEPPWDVIHYVTASAPPGRRSVLIKYLLSSSEAGTSACSLYSVRMEANYRPAEAGPEPVAVTFGWCEVQEDRSLVRRTHTQIVNSLPARYTINVGGADHPVMDLLRIELASDGAAPPAGYSDGRDVGGEKFVGRWQTVGRNLAHGKPYTVSVPSNDRWGAGDPEGTRLTDGIVGPPNAGGITPNFGPGWDAGLPVDITVDLGEVQSCGAFRINVGGGWPWWDSLKGEVQDTVEVFTSTDGQDFTSQGFVNLNLRRCEVPVNHMLPDDETLTAGLFALVPEQPVRARHVRFRLTPARCVCVNEVQVLDWLRYEPFDLRIALPDEWSPEGGEVPRVLTPAGRPMPATIAQRNVARPVGDPVLERPTLHSLGCYWVIAGDENRNARVQMRYRERPQGDWREVLPLFRVDKGAHRNDQGESTLQVPEDAWVFAGSALLLRPDTEYELALHLTDPDGAEVERRLVARTVAEPTAPPGMRVRYVVPGHGGGDGTQRNPFRGLRAAEAAAQPGDLFLLHAGLYPGTFTVTHSGEPGRPIIWRGEGEVVLDAKGAADEPPQRAISASDTHDVWYEGLTIRNATYGIVAHNSWNIVVRGCRIYGVDYGLTCTNNSADVVRGFFVTDNMIEGPCTWPRTRGIENPRGIQVTGTGHVVAYNRIRGFADAIDTFPSVRCSAIDIHHNDISEMTDDGIEMDYSERNTRCFSNRLTNVFQGISTQPIFGGPVYIFRNALYNVVGSPFKMHNNPSGGLMLHNTSVKQGMPMECFGGPRVSNFVYRNNLFIGTAANYAFESTVTAVNCDFDYDAFGGGPWNKFLKWNGIRYDSLEDVRRHAPVYAHAIVVDAATAFASGTLPPADPDQVAAPPDLRLRADCAAVDAGAMLPGLNDAFTGQAPDIGAYELGEELPHYGPR